VPLPAWSSGYWHTDVTGRGLAAWGPIEAGQLSARLQDFRFLGSPPPAHCARFSARPPIVLTDTTSGITATNRVSSVLPLGPSSFLLEVADLPEQLWSDGRIYLAGVRGLARWSSSRQGVERIASSTAAGGAFVDLIASPAGPPFELYALTASGALYRYDGQQLSQPIERKFASSCGDRTSHCF
jgi:hypothetical protein